jgi:MEDS: MEthanogen/methylotroph, DcmR Sensory domain
LDLTFISYVGHSAVNALVDDNNSTSPNPDANKRLYEDEVSNQLLHVPTGHHYLILYPNIETMRKVCSSYMKKQLDEQPNSVLLFLSYYDTTDIVRGVLSSKGINIKEREKEGSIIILDIMKVIQNPYFEVPDIEKLRELSRKTEKQFGDKTIFIIADMSVFNHTKKASVLLEYEKTLHNDLKLERWKELCLYNKRDFEIMFTKDESKRLMEYHKDKVISVT